VTPTKTCLDAETLAAWVDGGLDARAAAMAEAHVSSCPRCQEIAGLIVKTTPAAVPVESAWRFRAGWLVPLAAGLAAVGVWMIVPSDRMTAPPTATVAPVPEQQAKVKAPQEESRAKEQGTRFRDQAKNEAAASAKATAGQADQLAKKDNDQGAKRFDEAPADANKLRVQAAPPAATAVAAEAGRLEAQAPARQTFAQAAEAKREATSPDGSIRWRLTPTNTLERSADTGRTWVPVETGAGGPLASIQVTDANIATVTTVDGRQFRTTDSGKTWLKAP